MDVIILQCSAKTLCGLIYNAKKTENLFPTAPSCGLKEEGLHNTFRQLTRGIFQDNIFNSNQQIVFVMLSPYCGPILMTLFPIKETDVKYRSVIRVLALYKIYRSIKCFYKFRNCKDACMYCTNTYSIDLCTVSI